MSATSASEGLQDFSLDPEDNNDAVKLDGLTTAQLLELHLRIENKLGGTQLTDVNLVRETLLQVHRAKALQEAAQSEKGVPMNQRAQVQNSLGNMLVQLGKIQSSVFTSERYKRIQQAVVKVVKTLPKPQQDQFFELLEAEFAKAAEDTDGAEVTTE